MRYLVSLGTLALVVVVCAPAYAWLPVPPTGVADIVLDSQDAQLSSSNGPSDQFGVGRSTTAMGTSMRIKGGRESCPDEVQPGRPTGASRSWRPSCIWREPIQTPSATLWSLRRSTRIGRKAPFATGIRYWAANTEWAVPHSDITVGDLRQLRHAGLLRPFLPRRATPFRTYSYNGYTWIAMKIDPDLVYAMILDNPGGLAVTDARFHSGAFPGQKPGGL